jgi:DNA invertase Pin-like site-specific DNA recombinase
VGRSVKDVIEIESALRGCGVGVIFVREGIDTSTPTGELFRNVMASIAEFERKLIYERLCKGVRAKKAQGGYIGGRIPYGYRNESKELAIVPEEAAAIRRIFQLKLEGKSLSQTVELLNSEDVAKPRRSRAWSDSSVWGILKNRFYTGHVEFEGEWIPAQHEAIVSDVLFRRCNQ